MSAKTILLRAALRAHQAAADATKSPQREAAATDGEVPCHQRWEEAMKEVMEENTYT